MLTLVLIIAALACATAGITIGLLLGALDDADRRETAARIRVELYDVERDGGI
ncbi:MAG TPA: hypothetical protein VIW26_12020 [Gemmatimonadales bacterium]|jgi:hypothetical protein